MVRNRGLVLAHLWVAFAVFAAASVLGAWQMWVRSPLSAPFAEPQTYFASVTAHGTGMAYVLTTFFVMGFGYFVAETALGRDLPGVRAAWGAYALGVIGAIMAVVTVMTGRASVLYTFYPPMTASAFYYIGLVLVVVGSWIWCAIMIVAMARWKRDNPGQPVPLAMFATVANAIMWLWTTLGVAAELLIQVIPAAFGWTETIDVGLSRTLFSWTLHAIVYFWLFPAYIAFYTMAPAAAGGRLYSETMGQAQLRSLPALQPAGRPASFVHGPRALDRVQVHSELSDVSGHDPDIADGVHDHRLVRDRRAAARRNRAFRLDPRVAVGSPDGAGDRSGVFHAVVRRRRRPDKHELRHECDGSQHVVGHRPFPSDLRRHGRHHVFRDRLRDLAGTDRTAAGRGRAGVAAPAALGLGDRHAGHDLALALARAERPMAPGCPFRLCRPGDRVVGTVGRGQPDRRRAAGRERVTVRLESGAAAREADPGRRCGGRRRLCLAAASGRLGFRPRSTALPCGMCWSSC